MGFWREVTVNKMFLWEGIKPHSYDVWTEEIMEVRKKPGL